MAVGSTNPAKVAAVEAALRRLHGRFTAVTHVEVASGVPSQPAGADQARQGATARAAGALRLVPGALVGVGIEAGVERPLGQAGPLMTSAWVVVLGRSGVRGEARSAALALPQHLAAAVEGGEELGEALDRAYGLERANEGPGAAGVLTRGLVDRSDLYVQAVTLALSAWLAPAPSREGGDG